jgi:hypothetical protein
MPVKQHEAKGAVNKPATATTTNTTTSSRAAAVSDKVDVHSEPLRRKFSSIAEEAAAMGDSSSSSSDGDEGKSEDNYSDKEGGKTKDAKRGGEAEGGGVKTKRSSGTSSGTSRSSSPIDIDEDSGDVDDDDDDDDDGGVWRWTDGDQLTAPAVGSAVGAINATTAYIAATTKEDSTTAAAAVSDAPVSTSAPVTSQGTSPSISQPKKHGKSSAAPTATLAATPQNSVRPEDILARPLLSQVAPGVVFHRSRQVISVRISSSEFEGAIEPVLAQVTLVIFHRYRAYCY